ncbi:creatininase family protein [Dongia deserti]|uniref:creatininase family protein n=1 Tax=Dongia deserti TaxID=2268030 RepID=UPI0013C4436F|nr:creatininase family protein [Dongia deserti]
MAATGRFIEDLTWPEVAEAFKADVPVVLPIGAASKEHGRHLPMKADWLLARALIEGIAGRLPVLIAPIVPFGYYPVFRAYPGSQHVTADTFVRLLTELLEGLIDQGARRIAIMNTGVSTEGPVGLATRGILERRGIAIGVADIRRLGRKADHLLQQKVGSHADERETSVMLAIAPELVRMDQARADYGKGPPAGVFTTPTTMQSTDPSAADYSETGAFGDPTLASTAKGQFILEAMIEDLVAGLVALFPDLQPTR